MLRHEVKSRGGIIQNGVKARIRGKIEVGNQIVISSSGIDNIVGSNIFVNEGAYLNIGSFSGITASSINCTLSITIGEYVKIGAGFLIMDTDFHSLEWQERMTDERKDRIKSAPVKIDNHVFVGARSIICKGVHIGEHTIIGAGSVVVSNIPENCIAAGNPCRIIRQL